ncbi:putative ubiquitin-conjugating enzyme [Trypanosoma grayi]|uniref:putative ubiquitin-conjugating enzyme n=1 Tax=Trypanosoma grayi TaxID=71804 RepID=UPI0004F4442F|nr:putative ubiquitin-conjugating enzyme [Trypanosoma grayi]KEG15575.1 putative ubiquitin-conjugating enzyme [Trypanosoma grayi]
MEVLGRTGCGVMSLAASATAPTAFATVDSTGTVTLWDTRLRRKDYATVAVTAQGDGAEATELLLASDLHLAAVLSDKVVTTYDLRQLAKVQCYEHPCEAVTFLSGAHPSGTTSTLFADEDGAVVPFDLKLCAPTNHLSQRYFAVEAELPVPSFGSLPNYCCGLGLLQDGDDGRRLCAVGMDGHGALYADPLRPPERFCVMDDLVSTGGQVVNPPLPTACGFFENLVAIGRANGMYSIAAVDDADGVFEVLAAPGHASNGLCVVTWTDDHRLVTCSVCGEVSVWDVLPLLQQQPPEEGAEDGDVPPLDVACSVREATGHQSVVNCGSVLGCGVCVVGDTLGFVTSCSLGRA